MPRWKDLKRFLDRNAIYQGGKKHYVYSYTNKYGDTYTVLCSRSSGEIGHDLWHRILTRELFITQEEFNAGL